MPESIAARMFSDIAVFGIVMFLLLLVLLRGHMLGHAIQCMSRDADTYASHRPASSTTALLAAERSACLVHAPGRQRFSDLEAGLSQGYGTFDDFSGVKGAAAVDLDKAYPSVLSRRVTSPTPDAAQRQKAVPLDVPPEQPSVSSWKGASSPPESLLVVCSSAGSDQSVDTLSDLYPVHMFAKSGEGQVKVARQGSTGKLMVVKTVQMKKKRHGARRYEMPNEVAMLTLHLGRHPNIVVCHTFAIEEFATSPWMCHMVLECCSGGDLSDFCTHWRLLRLYQGRYVPEIFLFHCMISMTEALAYLHEGTRGRHPIIHRDIKPANIFLRWPSTGTHGMPDIVLSDFGFACYESESKGACGTSGYYQPETHPIWYTTDTDSSAANATIDKNPMTRVSDIYTLGATLYDLVILDGFHNENNSYTPANIKAAFETTPYTHSSWLLDVLIRTLADDPKDRLTTTDLVRGIPPMKTALEDMCAFGVRMPPDSWPHMPLQSELPPARAQSSSCTLGDGASVGDMSQISGFTQPGDLCWCPNHSLRSRRHPGPGCVRQEVDGYSVVPDKHNKPKIVYGLVTAPQPVAEAVVGFTGNTAACARFYPAEIVHCGYYDAESD